MRRGEGGQRERGREREREREGERGERGGERDTHTLERGRKGERFDTSMVYCCRQQSITMELGRLFNRRFVRLPIDIN